MEHFLQDLRYSWRLARSSRGSSAFIVLLLALGVGLNVAVFDLANAVLLRPLPVRDPDRLVRLVTVDPKLGPRSIFTHRTYEVLKEKSTSFSDVIAYSLMSTAARDDSGASSRVWCEVVTGNYFTATRCGYDPTDPLDRLAARCARDRLRTGAVPRVRA